MTGPEHYVIAEALLADAVSAEGADDAVRARLIARAQVHATLALAAATGVPDSGAEGKKWLDAAGIRPPGT